jgi:uncharacterized protein YjiS (DUF1127 family)
MSASQVKAHPLHARYADRDASNLQDRIALLSAKFGNWVRARRSYYRSVAELSAMSDRDLADIGISRSDIQAVARQAAAAKYGK